MATIQAEPQNTYTVRLRKPHDKQREFLRSEAKRIVIRAGRRGGKTTGIAIKAVEAFLAGRRVLYAAPTEDQVASFWWEIKQALAEPIDAGIYTKNETLHTVELVGTKQRIRAKTAFNADTLRGDYADLLIIDEWQLVDEDAWQLVGAPMLLDNDGDAVFIYTPPSLRSRSMSKARDPRHASKMYKRAEADPTGRWVAFTFTSHDNPHISAEALSELSSDMTRLAIRQEIEAEDIDEVPGAMYSPALIDRARVEFAPAMKRIVVGVDPSGGGDDIGIVAAGRGYDDHCYTLADRSQPGHLGPRNWATEAVNLYHELEADAIAAERNFGGDMVLETIRTVDPSVNVKMVTASRGKAVRAEPVASLMEDGRDHHVGHYPELEAQMTSWVQGDRNSPDRMDARVWTVTELMLSAPESRKTLRFIR